MDYRIQYRKYSSNIIEKKVDDKWIPFIAPLVKKTEGDLICNTLLEELKK